MNNIKKRISLLLLLTLVFSLAMPSLAYAAPEDANITMEYRYAEGETVEIPETITRAGREYRLISQDEPVLESTLPQTRTYTSRIDGALSKEDYNLVKDLANTTITPVYVESEREVDKTVKMNMPNNDVDEIPLTKEFSVTSPKGNVKASLKRAGVEFEIEKDSTGYPIKYVATVVYRGVETFEELGYYLVKTSYSRDENVGNINQYVVIATYEPVDAPVIDNPATTGGITTQPNTTPPNNETPVGTTTEFSDSDQALIDQQGANPVRNIVNGNVPLGSAGVKAAWSVLSFLIAALAVLFSVIMILTSLFKRKDDIEKYVEDSSGKTISIFLKIVAILLGIGAAALWYLLDDTKLPMVWINRFTIQIALVFVVQIIFFIAYSRMKNSRGDDNPEPAHDQNSGPYPVNSY